MVLLVETFGNIIVLVGSTATAIRYHQLLLTKVYKVNGKLCFDQLVTAYSSPSL